MLISEYLNSFWLYLIRTFTRFWEMRWVKIQKNHENLPHRGMLLSGADWVLTNYN